MSGATIILAALQNGSPLPADLDVAVSLRGGGLEILPWQVVYTGSGKAAVREIFTTR